MEEKEEEELLQPVFSTTYYTDDHLAEAPRREKMNVEGSGKPRRGTGPTPPRQQSRPEGQKDQREDRPAGENKRRRPPYRGGRRGGKGGDGPKT